MQANSELAREALRLLCEAGRADLLRPGVLGQAWVGLEQVTERPRRAASVGVSAAVEACLPQRGRRRAQSEARVNALEAGCFLPPKRVCEVPAPGGRAARQVLTVQRGRRGRSSVAASASVAVVVEPEGGV